MYSSVICCFDSLFPGTYLSKYRSVCRKLLIIGKMYSEIYHQSVILFLKPVCILARVRVWCAAFVQSAFLRKRIKPNFCKRLTKMWLFLLFSVLQDCTQRCQTTILIIIGIESILLIQRKDLTIIVHYLVPDNATPFT